MAEKVGEIFYTVTLDTDQMVDGSRRVQREAEGMSTKFTAVAAAAAVMAAALAAVKIAALADEFRLLGARVEVAAGSVEGGTAAMESLANISRRTQSSLTGNIEVFTRLNQSIKQMGGTQADTLQMTELLAKAIKVGGANAVEAKSAMLQFGQALGSGNLAGDELRSLLENAPYLMRQLADGIGVPVGSLKKLGEEGKLTADVVVNALTKASTKIDADFKKFPQTIESAMVVARDQAGLAALKFDDLTGISVILTGATKGLGEMLEQTAAQFGAMDGQADTLSRNDRVNTWSDITRLALSYVADAADLTWRALSVLGRNVKFVFEGVGRELGGIASQIAVFFEDGDPLRMTKAKWDKFHGISDAMRADAARARQELDKADAETLSRTDTMGQRMRNVWAMGDLGQTDPRELARRGRGPATPPVRKPPPGDGDNKGSKFDADGYLAGLEKATLEGVARVDAIEREALAKNLALLEAGKISRKTSAKAVTLIEREAAQERMSIQLDHAEQHRAAIQAAGEQEIAEAQRIARQVAEAQAVLVEDDPIARLEMDLQAKSALYTKFAETDLANATTYQAAKVALEQRTANTILALQAAGQQSGYAAAQSAAGDILGVLQAAGKDRTALGKALFLAEKSIAVATIIMNTEKGAAAALGMGPFGIPLSSVIRAAGYASAATVTGLAVANTFGGGRQYGGPVSAGSLYRVNETGAPEMYTGAGGKQYMLPTASGKVTAADQIGGSPQWTVVINNAPAGTTASVDNEQRIISVAVARAEANFVEQIGSNSGPQWSALRGSSNVTGRL